MKTIHTYMSIPDTAAYLGISKTAVQLAIWRGLLEAYKINKKCWAVPFAAAKAYKERMEAK